MHGPMNALRKIEMNFLTGCNKMFKKRRDGVNAQIILNDKHPNEQPQPKAMHMPQKNDDILYAQSLPHSKQLLEFFQTL